MVRRHIKAGVIDSQSEYKEVTNINVTKHTCFFFYAPADIYFILSSSEILSCSCKIHLFDACTTQVKKAVVHHHVVVCHVFPLRTEIVGAIADSPNATLEGRGVIRRSAITKFRG